MTTEDCKEPGPTDYSSNVTPTGYVCGSCGASGVKLWRLYQTFLDHQELLCAICAAASTGKSIEGIDAEGKRPHDAFSDGTVPQGRTDTIGWRVPAVPTTEGDTYWGYTSVPQDGVLWWRHLPTLPATVSRSSHGNR